MSVSTSKSSQSSSSQNTLIPESDSMVLDEIDRRIIVATQAGLPITSKPYHAIGESLGISGDEVQDRMQAMLTQGKIRRIAAVPNHYTLGYTANGMTVWNIPDKHVKTCGEKLGNLPNVSHCYRRPRHPPLWDYNLFAMLHGKSKADVVKQMNDVAEMLAPHVIAFDVLFSSAILKKTGLRIKS